jgi:putative restriction endonuclease
MGQISAATSPQTGSLLSGIQQPLLLLYALARIQVGSERLLPFFEVDRDVKPLLERFGPPRSAYHIEYPFWRLQNDGIWEVVSEAPLRSRARNSDPPRSELLAKSAKGGFKAEMFAALRDDRGLANELFGALLKVNFPNESHPAVMAAISGSLSSRV